MFGCFATLLSKAFVSIRIDACAPVAVSRAPAAPRHLESKSHSPVLSLVFVRFAPNATAGGHSQARIDRLAFERQYAEHTLVDTSERLTLNESLQPLDTQRELAQRKRSLSGQSPFP
jgi:hypothetical protein